MGFFSFLKQGSGALKKALQKGAAIIDVRTAAEFDQGHIKDAVNIPVDRIAANAERIREMKRDIVLCCDTGARSSTAKQLLLVNGIKYKVYNGGSWQKILRITRAL